MPFKLAFVRVSTVPVIASSDLVEINVKFADLDVKVFWIVCATGLAEQSLSLSSGSLTLFGEKMLN